jgi:hypothetical protein
MAAIRRLTQEGIAQFRGWVDKGAPSPAPIRTSEPVPGAGPVELRDFATRFELGEYLADRLSGVPTARIRFDAGLWDWLSLSSISTFSLRSERTASAI